MTKFPISAGNQALVKMLCDLKLVDSDACKSHLNFSEKRPIAAFANAGLLDEIPAIKSLAARLKLSFVDLKDLDIQSKIQIEPFAGLVDGKQCLNFMVFPLWKNPSHVVCGFANPLDHDAVKYLQFALAQPIETVFVAESDLYRLISQRFLIGKVDNESIEASFLDNNESVSTSSAVFDRSEDLDNASSDSPPVVKLCNQILAEAVRQEASDIHIEPSDSALDVRFRIDGEMSIAQQYPKAAKAALLSRLKLLSGMDISEKRRPQDGRLRLRVLGQEVDMRASSIPAANGEKLVFRLLRSSGKEMKFRELGFPSSIEQRLLQLLESKSKLLLSCGPTGSGKTTTLYTCLHHLRQFNLNIQTVEDPIEYRVNGINQVQVNHQIEMGFVSALRAMLRQDPDVIMIGEIRDVDTAQIALQAAETGHLVLSTLHTNDATQAINRLVHLGAEPFVIASALSGVVAQRLVRCLCQECKEPLCKDDLLRQLNDIPDLNLDDLQLFQSKGCKRCNGTGYKGRIGVYSFLEITPVISDLIHRRASIVEMTEEATRSGYITLEESALEVAKRGLTSVEQIRPYLLSTKRSSPRQTAEGTIAVHASSKSSAIAKQQILLVEDDENVRNVLSMVLAKEMYDVVEVSNGSEALVQVYKSRPALILCDLMMPIMDGRELLRRLQSHPQTSTIPVIILTAVSTEENEIGLLDIGASDFVSKTTSAKIMLSRIRRVLEDHNSTSNLHNK